MGFFDRMGNLGKGLINTLSDSEEQDHVKDLKRRAREAALEQELDDMRERGTWRQHVPEAAGGIRRRPSDRAAEALDRATGRAADPEPMPDAFDAKLDKLKRAFDNGILTREEYDKKVAETEAARSAAAGGDDFHDPFGQVKKTL